MLSYLFMKVLEGRPERYDRRMDRLSRGRVRQVKEAVASAARPGDRVLEIGCGTGELAALLAERGAVVHGFDASEAMVEVARGRLGEDADLRVMGVEDMDTLVATFDLVVATLVLSELSDHERAWALGHAARLLAPGGRLVVADEVVPGAWLARAGQAAVRVPMIAAAYLVSGSITRPLADLAAEVRAAGLVVDAEERSQGGAFALLHAHRPQEAA